jgi:hypothetical protein
VVDESALTLVNPTVQKYGDEASKGGSRARRLDTLAGKTVGLLWNAKPFGDVALRTVQRRLEDMYGDIEFRFYNGNQPHSKRLLDKAESECDAFVLCTADCGGCCLWAVHDAIEMEKAGKPAVVIVSHGFETNALAAADAFSMRDFAYVVVPKVYNNLSIKEAEMQTEPIIDDIVKALTDVNVVDREGDATSFGRVKPSSKVEFLYNEGNSYDNFLAFNREFLDRDWGDGFLLHPPTRNAIAEMLSMVDGQPDDVVCMLPPGNGEATVALVAANAVMAGCKPAEMPVVMAALRAIARNGAIAMSIVLTSTSAHACFIVVNGPLGRQLGINGKRACLGPGKQNEVNLRIGRAVVLCLKNIGRWYPGVLDLDTIGTSRKFINVITENEEENPWEPYHVSQGFDGPADTVTTFWSSGEWDVSIQGHKDAEQLARAIGSYSGGTNAMGYIGTLHGVSLPDAEGKTTVPATFGRLLLLTPPHAQPLADAGYSKQDLERLFWELGHEPIERIIEPLYKLHEGGNTRPEYEWMFQLSPEEQRTRTAPVIERPEDYTIVVAGSVRAKDLLMPTRVQPYTERITNTPDGT